jgi:hypothetical protein
MKTTMKIRVQKSAVAFGLVSCAFASTNVYSDNQSQHGAPGKRQQAQPVQHPAQQGRQQTPSAHQQTFSPAPRVETHRIEPRRIEPGRVEVRRIEPRPDIVIEKHLEVNRQTMRHMQDNRELREAMEFQQREFRRSHLREVEEKHRRLMRVNAQFSNHYGFYLKFGFGGGFRHPLHPIRDATELFYNPLWASFYVGSVDARCVQQFYGRPVVFVPTFRYQRVYLPTVEFSDVVVSVSTFPMGSQTLFQEGMNLNTELLAQKLSARVGRVVSLSANTVVITDRQVIRDDAIVLEGYVDYFDAFNGVTTRFGFKSFIDLRPSYQLSALGRASVFVPASIYGEPSYQELIALDLMNNEIVKLGGYVQREF